LAEPNVVVAAGDGADGAILVGTLVRHGFHVQLATDAGAPSALGDGADVALVDAGLPNGDALALVDELRRAGVPTVVVGGRRPDERAAAEAHGADAYLVRPVVASDLVATLRSLARATPIQVGLRFGPLVVDVDHRKIAVGDRRVHLAPREFDLLVYLAGSPRQVFGVDRLLRDVWHTVPRPKDAGTVAVHVRRLRQKLEAAGMPRCIETVKGKGYVFVPSDARGYPVPRVYG
jgi:DNA-binding response OmpR family regulator